MEPTTATEALIEKMTAIFQKQSEKLQKRWGFEGQRPLTLPFQTVSEM